MPDGTGDRLNGTLDLPHPALAAQPPVLLIHGLSGCEESPYMVESARHLLSLGHPVLRLNLRGSVPTRPHCRETYHAGRDSDLAAVLDQLADGPFAGQRIAAVGFSLGGNMLLKLLAAQGETGAVAAAVTVSAPIDLADASRRIMRPRNWFYHLWLLRHVKSDALALAGLGADEARAVRRSRTLPEFDAVFVAPRNGFASAQDYYSRCSSRQFLADIRVPVLLVQARNDPWIPERAYGTYDWSRTPLLTPLLPASGGHVGFHDCDDACWHTRVAARFLQHHLCRTARSSAGPGRH